MRLLKFLIEQSGTIQYPDTVDVGLVKRGEVRTCDDQMNLNPEADFNCFIFEYDSDLTPDGTIEHAGTFEQNFEQLDDPRFFAGNIEILDATGPAVHIPGGFRTHDKPRKVNGDPEYLYEVISDEKETVSVVAGNNGPAGVWSTPIRAPGGKIIYLKTIKENDADTTMTILFTPQESGDFYLTEELINRELSNIRFGFAGIRFVVAQKAPTEAAE